MKAKEYNKRIAAKKESELHRDLAEKREELRDLRFKDSQNQLKEVHAIKKIKGDIARILTVLNKEKNTDKEKTN